MSKVSVHRVEIHYFIRPLVFLVFINFIDLPPLAERFAHAHILLYNYCSKKL